MKASQRRFYIAKDILPDHLAYPLLMVVDKAQLNATSFPEKVWLQTEYGWRRLEYARRLSEQGKSAMAVTTIIKSQKYLLNATEETLNNETDEEFRIKMLQHLTAYSHEVEVLAARFDNAEKAQIDRLLSECEALKLRLSQSLSS